MSKWLSGWSGSGGAAAAADKEAKRAAAEEQHAKALQALREKLASDPDGATAAQQLVQGGELASADEISSELFLRRWLEAHHWDAAAAFKHIVSHAGWRAHLMPDGRVDEARIAEPLADKKAFVQGRDRSGRAFSIIKVSAHLAKTADVRQMKLFVCYVLDALVALNDPKKNPQGLVVSVFDMTNCALANLDVATMRMVLGLLAQHYVGRMGCLIFYNPPLVFWGLWNASKSLLPESMRSRIRMVDPKDVHELQEMVAPDVLPEAYGGAAPLLPAEEAVRRFNLCKGCVGRVANGAAAVANGNGAAAAADAASTAS